MEREILEESSTAIQIFNTFFDHFQDKHISVFLTILDHLDIKDTSRTELKRKLNHGYKLIMGLKKDNDSRSLVYRLFLLEDWLSQMTTIIDTIFSKMIRIRTQFRLGNAQWISWMEKYKVALCDWTILVEPLKTMKGVPIQNNATYKVAESRQVNTYNRHNKSIRLPHARPYQGNHFEEMPLGIPMNISRKPKPRKTLVKGSRI
jgi:hypothetical protein